jgi:hypothetical protein
VLLRTLALGIQLFLPLSVVGCAVLLSINLAGVSVDVRAAVGEQYGTTLLYFSMSNIPNGSSLYWSVRLRV